MRRLWHAGLPPRVETALLAAGAAAGFEVCLLGDPQRSDAAIVLGADDGVARRVLNWRASGLMVPVVVVGSSSATLAEAIRAGADHVLPDEGDDVAGRVVALASAPRPVEELVLG